MNQPLDSDHPNDIELTLETLDAWETELDEFAAEILQRLTLLSAIIELQPESEGSEAGMSQPQAIDDDPDRRQAPPGEPTFSLPQPAPVQFNRPRGH